MSGIGNGATIGTTTGSVAPRYVIETPPERPAPPPAGRSFAAAMGTGGRALAVAAGVALGPVASLAVRGAAAALGGGGSSSETEELRRALADGRAQNLELLRVQQEIETESRRFSALSNVLHARHETARAAINNIRA